MVRQALALFAIGSVVLLSACGSGDPPSTQDTSTPGATSRATTTQPTSSTTPPPSTESAPSNAGTKCVAADLEGVVTNVDAGAGSRFAELVVTNTSGRTCTVYGYGGLELIDANGKPNPTDLVRTPNPGPSLVTLEPGGTAAKKLRWGVIPSGDEPVTGPCQPVSTGIRVIPPDDTRAFTVSYEFGSVCSGGRVEGSAYFEN